MPTPVETPCLVRRAGISGNGRTILDLRAVDGSFDWNWFLARADMTREMLSIALAAITTEKQINCSIVDASASFSEITAMQLIK